MGPAHPWHCRGCGPLSPVGRSGGGSTGRPRSCVDEGERIMNDGATTAFLPNFVTFPSLRGLHSSTVQPERTPRPYGVRRACERPPGGWPGGRSWWGRGPGPRSGPRRRDAVPPDRKAQLPRVSRRLRRIRRPLPRRTTRLRRTSRHRRSGPSGDRRRTNRPRRPPTSCWCRRRCRRPRRCSTGAAPARPRSGPHPRCAGPPRVP